jgi:hypothetical protein
MKLNPPASSSDLDAARAIARRLHRRARGHERGTDTVPEAPAPPDEGAAPASPGTGTVSELPPFEPTAAEPATFEPAAPEPTPVEPAVPEPAPGEPAAPEPMPVEPAVAESELVAPAPAEPAAFEPAPEAGQPFEAPAAEATPFEQPGDGEGLPGLPETPDDGASAPDAQTIEAPPSELPRELEGSDATAGSSDPWASEATPAEGSAPVEAAPEDVEAPGEIVPDSAFGDLGAAEAGQALEGLEPPAGEASPEDLLEEATGPEWPEDNPLEGQIETETERAPDDLVSGAAPSWDDVADACRALAQAHGAMIVDPAGQILATRGTWPEPGPEAIGGRLVSMMEKTLQDAPTRSVSAPLAGQHLTAWRVPASEGYYTIVFMGDAPLGADVRAPVDVEINQALGR